MASRPHLSITLPRNFTFHYTDGQQPQTPEADPKYEGISQPPAPPRQTFKFRRRRAPLPVHDLSSCLSNDPPNIPVSTIETPEPTTDLSPYVTEPTPEPEEGYLAPTPRAKRLISPPKTPLSQISATLEDACRLSNDWKQSDTNCTESISRPSSSCSGISDSSVSLCSSMGSSPSLGGSCTSPESDAADPFTFTTADVKMSLQSSPLPTLPPQLRSAKRLPPSPKTHWTEAMDSHLMLTYMRCLQDPTVTPFKMLPGTAPPLGICHRVAREAKKTWKAAKHTSALGSSDTIRQMKSGSNTPTNFEARKGCWPKRESSARRRLRQLCKGRPYLSAHYSRLVRDRSPSPFQSSPRSGSEPSVGVFSPCKSECDSMFSTRDMNISLTTSTVESMQPGSVLSQLTSDAEVIVSRPQDEQWFDQPAPRSNAHQKSHSLQVGHGLGGFQHYDSQNILTSPFHAGLSSPAANMHTSLSQPPTNSSNGPTLASPLNLHTPVPLPRSFRRHAQFNLDEELYPEGSDMRQNLLKELFGASAESSHRRVRSRGFSLGDMGGGTRRLSSFFTPPALLHQPSNPQALDPSTNTDHLAPPRTVEPRLGSPFGGRSSNFQSNTFPRRFTPHHFEPSASFEERINTFSSTGSLKDPFI